MKKTVCVVLALVISAGTAWSVAAQTSDEGEAELRQLQAKQFQSMVQDPDDLDKMFIYAQTSIRLKDFEAAISTFDRMLIFNPDLPRVKLELGAAYFRIGSYSIARFYFEEVRDDPNTPGDLQPRIAAFLDQIDQRTATSSFSGVVSASVIGTTNANNGPDSPFIDFQGAVVALSNPEATSQSDVGGSFSLSLTHAFDLGETDGDTWRTNFAYYSARFADTDAGAADVVVLRTGPQLSLDDERYGPKVRPYVELDHVRSSLDPLYSTIGVGAEYNNTLDASRTIFGDLRVAYRDFEGEGALELDRANVRGRVGLLYFLDQQTALRGTLGGELDAAGAGEASSAEVSLIGGINRFYDSGFDFAGRRWLISGTAQVGYRQHFAQDSTALVRRKDLDVRLGIAHTAFLQDGLALNVKLDYFFRESNSRNFEVDSLTLSGGVSYYF